MTRNWTILAGAAALFALSAPALAQTTGYPADAEPGQCFARVLVPERAVTVEETILDAPQRTEVRAIPARYEEVEEQVLVREATTEYRVVPATYRTVTETVVIEPERVEQVIEPASVETYTERVLIRPAYVTWQPGRLLYGRTAATPAEAAAASAAGVEVATGELLCRVEVPAEYATVTRRRTVAAASVQTRMAPARTQQVAREVMVTPARVEQVPVPAQYRTVRVRRMVEPARQETVVVPASYRTVQRRIVQAAGGVEWREVLCETNATPAKIRQIQAALNARGHRVRVDGAYGAETQAAVERFQRANGLPVGVLTIDTVRALGVDPR